MADSVNLTQLTANLGAHCQEFKDELFQDTLLGMEDLLTDKGITLFDGVKDKMPLTNFEVGDILKPGSDYETFSPNNNVIVFDNRELRIQPVKADLKIFPQKFEKTWLQHNANGRRTIKNWEDVPYAQYIMERILKKAQRELRKATVRGELNPSGTGFLDICDGIVTIMKEDVSNGDIPTVDLGAINPSNVIQKLEQMAMEATEAYREEGMIMQVPSKIWDYYTTADPTATGRILLFNENPSAKGNPLMSRSVYLRVGNVRMVENADLVFTVDSAEIFMTKAMNIIVGTHSYTETNAFDFEKEKRGINMMMDFSWGVNYALANTTNKPIICSEAFIEA